LIWLAVNNKNFCPFSFFGQINTQCGKRKQKTKSKGGESGKIRGKKESQGYFLKKAKSYLGGEKEKKWKK